MRIIGDDNEQLQAVCTLDHHGHQTTLQMDERLLDCSEALQALSFIVIHSHNGSQSLAHCK